MPRRPPIAHGRPDPPDRRRRLDDLERRCRAAGVPCTPQRRAILGVVLELDTHPTADEVYELVASRKLRVSRATVFRTLESLVRLGLIAKTCHPGRGVRYDRVTELHHHLVCLRCDRMVDIVDERLDALRIPDTSAMGFEISDFRVQLRGLCKRCREKERS